MVDLEQTVVGEYKINPRKLKRLRITLYQEHIDCFRPLKTEACKDLIISQGGLQLLMGEGDNTDYTWL